ncbi:Hsp20/alpha crystallin family protein [Brevibacterium samyangense]|uniref:Hsp20/alpha crystallin family protein n=1 Tax=Brevibacterium samyangense TaxID=366888 RepID=A0ABP5EXE9_9MICO
MAGTLTRIDPFSLIDEVFGSMRSPFLDTRDRRSGFVPALDVSRHDEDLHVRVDLPGLDPEKDVNIDLSGRTLTISGERRTESDEDGIREVRYGSFSRTVTIPTEVSPENVTARYEAGVLTVTVAGVYAQEQPHRIPITAGDADDRKAVTAG